MIKQTKQKDDTSQKQYKADKKLLINNAKRYTNYLEQAMDRLKKVQTVYTLDSKEYKHAYDEVQRWKYNVDESKLQLKFIRPGNQLDIGYRNYQYDNFVNKLREVFPDDLDLRFHGTTIYYAEQIIKTGRITSTADRYNGYIKSTDLSGEISASNIETIDTTISFFSDLISYQRSLPCGCVFALTPNPETDIDFPNVMKAVDFKKDPSRLFAIFTTPENTPKVKKWINEAGLDSDKVYTFEGFLEAIQEKSKETKFGKTQKLDCVQDIPNNFGIEEIQKIASNSRTSRLANLQSKLKSIFSIKRMEEKDYGTDRD